jgi:hypothetical protein
MPIELKVEVNNNNDCENTGGSSGLVLFDSKKITINFLVLFDSKKLTFNLKVDCLDFQKSTELVTQNETSGWLQALVELEKNILIKKRIFLMGLD